MPLQVAIDVTDPEAHADQRIHDAFTWLRGNEPVALAEPPDFEPLWVITKHSDICDIASRSAVGNSQRNAFLFKQSTLDRMKAFIGEGNMVFRNLLQMDQPEHRPYRMVTADYFQKRRMNEVEPTIRTLARKAVDRMAEYGGECDFASQIAFSYPLRIVVGLLGLSEENDARILHLTQEMFTLDDADRFVAAQENFNAFFDAVIADRRASPRDDLASLISNARINGEPMPLPEARGYLNSLATAGHETTASVIGGAVQALCENAREFERIKADRSLIPGLIDEAIRWVSPNKITMRTAVKDIEIRGSRIGEGDAIGLAWASGNRDEEVFGDPFTFRSDRKPNKLLSFGAGPHGCLGQQLARMQMNILFEEIFERVESMELTGEVKNTASLLTSGPKSVPIRYRMA
jgi:hypothetical protein